MNLRGKKLLILGATGLMCSIIERAHELGVFVIATDYFTNAPAKVFADKSYNISTTDLDGLEKIIEQEKVDGIFTGFSDVNLRMAAILSEKLGVPFYANIEQVNATTDKLKFKQICRKYSVPVVKEFSLSEEIRQDEIEQLEFPVIIKPADSYASKGISVCESPEQLSDAYHKALCFSSHKQVIVEKYLTIPDAVAYYVMVNGEVRLAAMADRHVTRKQEGLSPLPLALAFPSRQLERFCKEVNPNICKMFQGMGMKNGVAFVQLFADDNEFAVFEMGYRLNGAREYSFINNICGFNELDMLLAIALKEDIDASSILVKCNPFFEKKACDLVILLGAGKISKVLGVSEVKSMKEVILFSQQRFENDMMERDGTLNQVFARIHIVTDSQEAMRCCIEKIYSLLNILDDAGDSMILDRFDVSLV